MSPVIGHRFGNALKSTTGTLRYQHAGSARQGSDPRSSEPTRGVSVISPSRHGLSACQARQIPGSRCWIHGRCRFRPARCAQSAAESPAQPDLRRPLLPAVLARLRSNPCPLARLEPLGRIDQRLSGVSFASHCDAVPKQPWAAASGSGPNDRLSRIGPVLDRVRQR